MRISKKHTPDTSKNGVGGIIVFAYRIIPAKHWDAR